MRVVVTGCNGMLGRACARALLEAGHAVQGVDARPVPDAPHGVTIGDLRDPATVHRGFEALGAAPDAVVHLANHQNVNVAPPETVLRENLAMNSTVFLGAVQSGVRRLVFSSSVQAMLGGLEREFRGGDATLPESLPVSERHRLRPTNAYGLSKLLGERTLEALCAEVGFGVEVSAVALRLPYILRERAFGWASEQRTAPESLWGATEAFSYVHEADAAAALRAGVEWGGEGFHALWISAPDPRPPVGVAELVDRCFRGVPGADDARARGSLVDTGAAESLLGWRAERTLIAARSSG